MKLFVVNGNQKANPAGGTLFYLAKDVEDLLTRCMDWLWLYSTDSLNKNPPRDAYDSNKAWKVAKRDWQDWIREATTENHCETGDSAAKWTIHEITPQEIEVLKKFNLITPPGQ